MTNTELVLAFWCVFLQCMLGLSLIDRRKTYDSGYRNGRIAAGIEYERRNATPPASDTVERLVGMKKERISDEH